MVEFVLKTDDGILRDPKDCSSVCHAIYIIEDGMVKTHIIKTGTPKWFIRHFASYKLGGSIKRDFKEYHIMIDDLHKSYNSITKEVKDVFGE